MAEKVMLTFAENGHPVFRSTSPLSRGVLKSKGGGKFQYTIALTRERLKLFFAQLLPSTSSVLIHGAVSDMCEECNICHDRTGQLVVARQCNLLFVPSLMKTHMLVTVILHKMKICCKEIRNELKSYHNKKKHQILY